MKRNDEFQPQTLRESLESYTVPTLKRLAGLLTSEVPKRKAELVGVIQEMMDDTAGLRGLWHRLDPIQQSVASEMVYSSSCLDEITYRAKYGENVDLGQTGHSGGAENPSLLSLFLYNGAMPYDLRERLKEFVPRPRAAGVETTDNPATTFPMISYEYDQSTRESKQHTTRIPVIRCETERNALHDVHAVLRLIDTGRVRVSEKTRRPTAASMKTIAKILQGGDFFPPTKAADRWHTVPGPIKAFAWPLILQSAGLAKLFGNKLQLTPAGKRALKSPPQQVIRKAWDSWLKTKLLDEFNRVHAIKGQTGKGKRNMTSVPSRRTAIVKALRKCPTHEWFAFDEFSRFVRASGRRFEVSRNLWTLYIEDSYYGCLMYDTPKRWHIVQARYLLAFLFEYIATMGLIDIAFIPPSMARKDYGDLWGVEDVDCLSQYDGLLYLRINGLGSWCLGLNEDYIPSPIDAQNVLKVLPNFDVVAIKPLPPRDMLFLEMFSEQTSDVVWKIQATNLIKALEEGHSLADIESFLKARTGDGLPNNVAVFFKTLAERVSHLIDLGPARLIEAQDAILAQLVTNDSRLRSLCMLAGERHIVVPKSAERAFRRILRDLGYGLSVHQGNGLSHQAENDVD